MRNTFRKLWLAPLGALCLMAASSAEEASDAKKLPPAQASVQQEPPEPASVTVLGSRQAQSVLGREVRSSANENMGRIVDVIVDREGRVRAAVIDFGGFLGVGSRKIVVDWSALHFGRVADKKDNITLELNKAQVAAAPEYKEDTPIVVLGAAGNLEPFEEH